MFFLKANFDLHTCSKCDCFGRQFNSTCEAHSRGINVRHIGRCHLNQTIFNNSQTKKNQLYPLIATKETDVEEQLIGLLAHFPDEPTDGCINDDQCPEGAFCLYPESKCPTNYQKSTPIGVCVMPPTRCKAPLSRQTEESMNVCGCDGNTYKNRCDALKHKTSIASEGPCKKTASSNSYSYYPSERMSSRQKQPKSRASFFADANR
eukprot:MONOS_16198.2-p1 / transcript=MONOS_16198.2 / gene=MONOS_16198 / organism=Monocercomonoides_exilis_PA203 / gene_product=unspecified product / transcript_product=unspecified product / location=Mono_scaffold01560:5818-6573(+) / protein_length=205 / sequence_SO=supercontig / SO=protein_coding / is_pseudo=false